MARVLLTSHSNKTDLSSDSHSIAWGNSLWVGVTARVAVWTASILNYLDVLSKPVWQSGKATGQEGSKITGPEESMRRMELMSLSDAPSISLQ